MVLSSKKTSNKMMLKSFVSTTVLVSSLVLSPVAQAQIAEQTGIADPARNERRLSEDINIPQVAPNIQVDSAPAIQAPAGAENITFNFSDLNITGMSAYNKEDIAYLYEGQIGQTISLLDLYDIANNLTRVYRNDGYILSQVVVPEQSHGGGVANLRVVEGFIDQVTIQAEDESGFAVGLIEDYATELNEDQSPLDINQMERQLLLINDLPGVDARTVVSPSATTQGAADIAVIVERDPIEGVVSVDNHGSRFLGPIQVSGAVVLNSVLGLNERITTQIAVAPDDGLELGFGSIGYEQPINDHGTMFQTNLSYTDTDPGFTLDEFNVNGESKYLSIGLEHPVVRSRETNIFARGFFDARNVDSDNNVATDVEDRIRAIRGGVRAEFLDRTFGVAVNSVDVEVAQGLGIFGASDSGDAGLSRAEGDPTFLKANIRAERLQRVTNDIDIQLSARGQISNDSLLSSEEFGLGGYRSVRGFDPSQVVGDDGISGNVEVQWNNNADNVEVFGFFDAGKVWDDDATTAANRQNSLVSTGLGVRLELPFDVNAEFAVAQPLNSDVATRNDRDPQYFFSLTKRF